MIFRAVSVLAVTLALGVAFPNNIDTIVPESNLASVTDLLQTGSSFELARTKVHQLLQKGTTTDDCKALAQNTIDEISSAVTSVQQRLDELDKGHNCATEGQAEVTVKQGELETANTNAANAATALQTATVAPVTLVAQPGNTLGGAQCSWIEADPAYVAYVETLRLATEDHTTTKALATAAQTALDDAIADAARLKHECLCRVQTEHAAAWALIDNNDETRAASWAQAHNMICVVDHTTHANCAQPAVPTNTQPSVNDEVATEGCTADEVATYGCHSLDMWACQDMEEISKTCSWSQDKARCEDYEDAA